MGARMLRSNILQPHNGKVDFGEVDHPDRHVLERRHDAITGTSMSDLFAPNLRTVKRSWSREQVENRADEAKVVKGREYHSPICTDIRLTWTIY